MHGLDNTTHIVRILSKLEFWWGETVLMTSFSVSLSCAGWQQFQDPFGWQLRKPV
jgi:hypothetical protein